jgi:hypothetical protein
MEAITAPADEPAAAPPSPAVQRTPSEPEPGPASRPLVSERPTTEDAPTADLELPSGVGNSATVDRGASSGDRSTPSDSLEEAPGDLGPGAADDVGMPGRGISEGAVDAALPLLGRRSPATDRPGSAPGSGPGGLGADERSGPPVQRAPVTPDFHPPKAWPDDPAEPTALLSGEPPVRHEQAALLPGEPPVVPGYAPPLAGGPPAEAPPLVAEPTSAAPDAAPGDHAAAPQWSPTSVDISAPLLGVQRAPETVPSALGQALQPIGGDLADVRVHRDQPTVQAAADRLQARAFTVGGEIHLPARHGPLASPPAQALLAHELVHVAQQRRLGLARPAEHTTPGQELEREAMAVERAVTVQGLHQQAGGWTGAPPALLLAGDQLRRPATPRTGELLDPRSTALASGAASLDEDGAVVFAPPAGEPPQLSPSGADTASAPQRAPIAPPVDPAPAVPAAAPGGASGADLDELARRLYDRIRLRLRTELRLDRERSGQLTDLRH